MCTINFIDKLSLILVIIGSLNWGLFGLLNFDVLNLILGFSDILIRSIYIIIGLSGLNLIRFLYCLTKNSIK